MKNYDSPNANPAQSGRVDVPPRPLSRVTLRAALDLPKDAANHPVSPKWVLVDGQGRAAVCYGEGYPFDLVDRDGKVHRAAGPTQGPAFLLGPPGVWTTRAEVRWTGEITMDQPPLPGALLAAKATPPLFQGVFRASPRGAGPEDPNSKPYQLEAWVFREGPPHRWTIEQHDEIEGIGAGAIDAQGRAVLATDAGRLVVTGPEMDADRRPIRHVDVATGVQAYLLSATPEGYVVLEPRRQWAEAKWEGGDFDKLLGLVGTLQGDAAARRALFLDPASSPLDWKTGIFLLDSEGKVKWKTEAAYPALSPPIDLGAGRVAIVGRGIGVVQGGAWLWALPADIRLFATAFADGTLAVAWGYALSIVAPTGVRLAELRVPGEQPITAPPAIAEDGSVWLAGPGGLFVAE